MLFGNLWYDIFIVYFKTFVTIMSTSNKAPQLTFQCRISKILPCTFTLISHVEWFLFLINMF